MEQIITIQVTIKQKSDQQPITGSDYKVNFFDKDLISDDALGSSSPDDSGLASVQVTRKDFRSEDSPLENHPDVYFTVEKHGDEIFTSPVCKDLKVDESFNYPDSGGLVCDLGTFLI